MPGTLKKLGAWAQRIGQPPEDDDEPPALLPAILRTFRRFRLVPLLLGLLAAWLGASIMIHLVESGEGPAFETWGESLWSVLVIMFSGLEVSPQTILGRIFALIVLGAGIGLVALFTGAIASALVELRIRSREVSNFEMEDHLVLCNWAPRGLEWIREVHNKLVQDRRPVVIIHDSPAEIDLPDTADDPAFNDVYIVKGDPASEIILRRARVSKAHSIVVLSDDRQGEHADGKTILTCIAIKTLCKGSDVNLAVECRIPTNRNHLAKAGADEIISSDELGLRLMARTALYHGMTHVYQELLSVGRDANEMYLIPVPTELVGRDFVEIASMFLRYRNDKRSCLVIGIQRGDEIDLNPIGTEAAAIREGDHLVILSRVFINESQTLPTVPPIGPKQGSNNSGSSAKSGGGSSAKSN